MPERHQQSLINFQHHLAIKHLALRHLLMSGFSFTLLKPSVIKI